MKTLLISFMSIQIVNSLTLYSLNIYLNKRKTHFVSNDKVSHRLILVEGPLIP